MRVLVLLLCVVWLAPVDAAAADAAFRAGAAAVDITPQRLPVSMTGSFQDRQAAAVHDPLHARGLVLDDGKTTLAIVVCDSCLISREIFDAAKTIAAEKTDIPTSHMLMSATHTHTAATAVSLAQCHADPDYVRFLTRQIAEAVIQAQARLQPARLGWAVGQEADEVGNRRWFVKPDVILVDPFGRHDDQVRMNPPRGTDVLLRPAGPTDPDVALVSLQDAQGRPLALLANYSLHYVGGIPPDQLSADYFGEFARQIAGRLQAPDAFVAAMSNGTSGDVNNYNFRQPRPRAAPFERVRQVAARIADVAHQSLKTVEHTEQVSLAVAERTIDLGVRRPPQVEVERAQEVLGRAENPQRLNTSELYAQETLRLAEYPPTVNVKLQALRIGPVGIVAIPCEVFAEIGLTIKRRSPLSPTFTIGLANGYNGYLPTPRQHALGGYETWRSGWSYLEIEASEKITEAVLKLLDEVAPQESG